MGYYLEVAGGVKGKAQALASGKLVMLEGGSPADPLEKFSCDARWKMAPPYTAEIVRPRPAWEDIPAGKVLVVIIDNGVFEAAGVAYSKHEYEAMTRPGDHRLREYVLIDRDIALEASGAPR